MFAVFRKPKTFKLRALHSQSKFGVAGRSCEEVLRKGCLHLQVPAGRGLGRGLGASTCRCPVGPGAGGLHSQVPGAGPEGWVLPGGRGLVASTRRCPGPGQGRGRCASLPRVCWVGWDSADRSSFATGTGGALAAPSAQCVTES